MANIAWLHSPDNVGHNYGIELATNDPEFMTEFAEYVGLAASLKHVGLFTQGKNEHWIFIEFYPSTTDDKIFNMIEIVGNEFSNRLESGEILLDAPTREELLEQGF